MTDQATLGYSEIAGRVIGDIGGCDVRRLLCLLNFGLSVFLAFSAPVLANPVLSGNLLLAGTIQVAPSFSLGLRSDLNLNLTIQEISWTSRSLIRESGFSWQSFRLKTPLGVFDVSSELTFLPSVPRMDYWLTRFDTALAGLYFTWTFLLEYSASVKEYGSGLEFRLATEFPNRVSLLVKNAFGLEENLAEVYGWTLGSGYDIVDRPYLNSLTYTSTTVELAGFKFSDCKLSTTLTFNKAGFDYCQFELSFTTPSCPLRFEVEVTFTPTEKTVVIYPAVILYANCLKVYASVTPWPLTETNSSIRGLRVDGFSWRCEFDSAVLSGLVGVGDVIWRPRLAPNDISLRAYNYIVGPDLFTAIHYVPTTYNAVISWEHHDDFAFAVDWYFSSNSFLFGISLVTVELKFSLCDQITFTLGASIGSSSTALTLSSNLVF